MHALNAAKDVYELPDLDGKISARDFVQRLRAFVLKDRGDYQLYSYFSEPEAGLKYMLLQPKDPQKPWILAITGTQSILDWAADLSLGRAQFDRIVRIQEAFTTCRLVDPSGAPLASHPLIITGHSLGGGVAEAFAYRIQKARMTSGLAPLDMKLVTFNGFGAQQLVEQDERYIPWIVGRIDAANFYVRGDMVSRIGVHIGPTYQITPTGEDPGDNAVIRSPSELVYRHGMATVVDLAESQRLLLSGLAMARRRSPPAAEALTSLARFGAIARGLPEYMYSIDQGMIANDRVVTALEEATALLMRERLPDPKTVSYVRVMVESRLESLRAKPSGVINDVFISRLNQLGRKLH